MRKWALIAVVAAVGFLLPTSASAGNIWLTGHDADFHCRFGSQCNHFGIAIDFARQGAPDPSKPILVLDARDLDVVVALGQAGATANNSVEGAGSAFAFTVLDPTSAAFAALDLSTDDFSAIVIASDFTCGGCDLNNSFGSTPHSDAINARSGDIADFFNAGGGLVYFAGAANSTVYYASVPVDATPVAVSPPFTLTAEGIAIGLIGGFGGGSDTNCCATHNSFLLPDADSLLVLAEFDSAGFAETLFAAGVTIGEGGFEPGDDDEMPVPVPSTIFLFLVGLGGLGISTRFHAAPPQ